MGTDSQITSAALAGLLGAGIGGGVSYSRTQDPKKKRRNALLGALGGGLAGGSLGFVGDPLLRDAWDAANKKPSRPAPTPPKDRKLERPVYDRPTSLFGINDLRKSFGFADEPGAFNQKGIRQLLDPGISVATPVFGGMGYGIGAAADTHFIGKAKERLATLGDDIGQLGALGDDVDNALHRPAQSLNKWIGDNEATYRNLQGGTAAEKILNHIKSLSNTTPPPNASPKWQPRPGVLDLINQDVSGKPSSFKLVEEFSRPRPQQGKKVAPPPNEIRLKDLFDQASNVGGRESRDMQARLGSKAWRYKHRMGVGIPFALAPAVMELWNSIGGKR